MEFKTSQESKMVQIGHKDFNNHRLNVKCRYLLNSVNFDTVFLSLFSKVVTRKVGYTAKVNLIPSQTLLPP